MSEMALWIGAAAITANFVVNLVRLTLAGRRFELYLMERHPREYHQIYIEGWLRKAFVWPFMRERNPVQFLTKSSEDFGDPRVGILRAHIKQSFVLMVASTAAIPLWFLIVGALIPVLIQR